MKSIYVPLLDNGSGQVMANFMMDHAAAFAGREVYMVRASDSHANRGMNKIANAFLESACEIWINIDADIRFTKQNIDRLLNHNLPLVYGLYPKKQDDCPPCVCTFDEVPVPDANGLAIVRRAGRGFMLVHREVLERMKEDNGGPALRYHNHEKVEWDFFPSGVVTGELSAFGDETVIADGLGDVETTSRRLSQPKREWISEDWMFCERARTLGYKTYVDTGIALGHVGHKEYRFPPNQITHVNADGVTHWTQIDGWFTEADAEAYRRIATLIPDGGTLTEVGTWMGRSLGAFATFIREAGKSVSIHAVDTFKGTLSEGDKHTRIVAAHGGSIRPVFESNMKAMGVNGELTVHEMESLVAAGQFEDRTLDAVFIDGDHTFDAVTKDVGEWIWKVRQGGGVIAGHDYDYPDVARAVHQYFDPEKIEKHGRCWLVKV